MCLADVHPLRRTPRGIGSAALPDNFTLPAPDDAQLTLGQFIDLLAGLPAARAIQLADGRTPDCFVSWRGSYADVSLHCDHGGILATVGALRLAARATVGATLEGWKGGEFVMDLRTPLWADRAGECTMSAPTGITFDPLRGAFVIVCQTFDL